MADLGSIIKPTPARKAAGAPPAAQPDLVGAWREYLTTLQGQPDAAPPSMFQRIASKSPRPGAAALGQSSLDAHGENIAQQNLATSQLTAGVEAQGKQVSTRGGQLDNFVKETEASNIDRNADLRDESTIAETALRTAQREKLDKEAGRVVPESKAKTALFNAQAGLAKAREDTVSERSLSDFQFLVKEYTAVLGNREAAMDLALLHSGKAWDPRKASEELFDSLTKANADFINPADMLTEQQMRDKVEERIGLISSNFAPALDPYKAAFSAAADAGVLPSGVPNPSAKRWAQIDSLRLTDTERYLRLLEQMDGVLDTLPTE